MTSPDALRQKRSSYAVILLNMIREFQKDRAQIFLLLEGKDADYFRPRISTAFAELEAHRNFKNCQGKRNLKELCKAVAANVSLKEARSLAFFDRDYEHDLCEISVQGAFVTDGYSIENYYCELPSVREAIRSLIFAESDHDERDAHIIDELCARYTGMREKFHEAVLLFNLWAWCQREIPRQGAIDLDLFEVAKFVKLDFGTGEVRQCYGLDDLNALCPQRSPIRPAEIRSAEAWFKTRNASLSFRGKQEMQFLVWFLTAVINCAAGPEVPFIKRRKCSKRVSLKEAVSELSAYAGTPRSLVGFLRRMRATFI